MLRRIFAVAVASLFIGFVGCGKSSDPAMLEGTWLLTKAEMSSESDTGKSESENRIPTEQNVQYVFKSGRMSMPQTLSQQTYSAAYFLKGNDLTLQGDDGKNFEFQIEELSQDTMKLKLENNVGNTKSAHYLTFQRMDFNRAAGEQTPSLDHRYSPTN